MEHAKQVWINGDMVDALEATVSVFDRGFQYGDSVFEGITCKYRRVFKLSHHVARLLRSARTMGIEIPLTPGQISEAVKTVVRANGFDACYVKVVVSRGTAKSPGLDARNAGAPTIVIFAEGDVPFLLMPPLLSLASVNVRKIPASCIDPRVKGPASAVHIQARREAVAAGADEAVLYDLAGHVSEGAGDNIFLVKDGELFTPPPCSALEGITRATVIEIARREGFAVHEVALTKYDLHTADEIFLTGTGVGVAGVGAIDGLEVSGGEVGPMTRRMQVLYDQALMGGEEL